MIIHRALSAITNVATPTESTRRCRTRGAFPLAFVAVLLSACAHDAMSAGVQSPTESVSVSESDPRPTDPSASTSSALFVSFAWDRTAESCAGDDAACRQSFEMVGAGRMLDDDRGVVRTVRARSEDYEAFARLVTDETVLAALRDGTGCTPTTADADAADAVEVQVGGRPLVRGRLAGCTGEPFVAMRTAVERLRGRYFAQ